MKNMIALLTLFLLLTINGYAGGSTLRFVDTTGKPIPGVIVAISYVGLSPRPNVISDDNGVVTINHPCGVSTGSCCTMFRGDYSVSKPGFKFSPNSGSISCSLFTESVITGTMADIASVSAASYRRTLTSEMIIASFGENLASTTESATLPLKTTLGGRSVLIKDSSGTEKNALLLFVSSRQINYIMPAALADGPASIMVIDESGKTISLGVAEISKVSPGIFTVDSSGQGVPSAIITRVKPDGSQVVEPVAQFDATQGKIVPIALDLGPESEFVVLSLFGTGWRQVDSISQAGMKIAGIDCPVEYVDEQPTVAGLDQFNARLPRTLIGQGDVNVEVTIGGVLANVVQLKFK